MDYSGLRCAGDNPDYRKLFLNVTDIPFQHDFLVRNEEA